MKFLCVVFLFSFLLPFCASAADSLVPIPKNMQQRWVIDRCDTGEMAYRFSEYFLLTSSAYGSRLKRIGGFRDEGYGRYSMVNPGEVMGFVVGTSGDLLQYYDHSRTSFTAQSLEDKSAGIPYITFRNCPPESALLIQENQMLADLMPGLDKIHAACPTRADILTQSACQKAVFTLFDDSGDDMLDRAEMARAWEMIVPHSFRTCGPTAPKEDVLEADGASYMNWMLSNLDQNSDGKISFAEMQGQWKKLHSDSLMSGLTNMLIAAEKPLGILPEDMKMTCVNCCIATGILP